MAISDYLLAACHYLYVAKTSKMELARTIGRTPTLPKECNFCYETKPYTAFPRIGDIPKHCRNCVIPDQVACCKDCLKSTMAVQVQSKHPRQIQCPRCPRVWTWMAVMIIFGDSQLGKQRKAHYIDRLLAFDGSAESYQPPEDCGTLALLIQQGSRLCPHCARPFQRTQGCEDMWCGHCCNSFVYGNTVSVEEAHALWVERRQKKGRGK